MDEIDFAPLLEWDEQRRRLIGESESLKARRNTVSSEIPKLKKEGKDVGKLISEMKEVSGKIKELDTSLEETRNRIHEFLVALPNIPDDDVPAGGKESNQVERTEGAAPEFTFEPKNHVDLVTDLGMIDYERGVKLGGNGFWLYRGIGARLEWALLNMFIETHQRDGYEFILPPHLLVDQCGYTAGQFPKFRDDVYHLQSDEEAQTHFLLPTAETALINFHRDEILAEGELPKKYFAYTPCYRREAGSYRAQERGMIRGHQFNKVELFQFTTPADSPRALKELLEQGEKLVRELGLHYRVSKLAAKDCSASMAKTYDIEVWIPSMSEYKEVSSASNAREFQARRGNIRYKPTDSKRNELIHSLNASGLATSRVLPAIVEQFQQADGSVALPKVLADRLGTDRITPVK